jgi:ABC-2 type transport system permease protein
MRIRGDRVRWLFWLRWKMFSRMFTARQARQITGLVLSLLIIVPLSLGIAVATYLAYRFLPAPVNAEILTLVLSGLFILWLTLPLFEYNVNEGLNVAKLVLFPLSREELMLSLLLSTLFDVPTLGMLLLCLAVIIGWASSPLVVLMSSVTMLIFFAQLIGCSQLVLALLGRVMQSRRFRDVSILLIGLFSSSCYLIQQLVFRGLGARQLVHALYDQAFSRYLQWLPPGMAAQVILQATRGSWLLSFAWLLPLLAITLLVLYLWQIVV